MALLISLLSVVTGENRFSGLATRSNTNRHVKSKKKVRILKFWVEVEEELYYLRSENKGADQLCGNCVCFHILLGKNPVF